jgi:hypothetical protein
MAVKVARRNDWVYIALSQQHVILSLAGGDERIIARVF